MIKLKLHYKVKTSRWFLIFGIILAVASTVMGINSLIQLDYKYATFSLLVGALLFFTVYKSKSNKDQIKTQEVEVDSYEEIK